MAKKQTSMTVSKVPAEPKLPKLKYRVISVYDYFAQAREIYGKEKIWDRAVALIYSEHDIIDVIMKGDEAKFIVAT